MGTRVVRLLVLALVCASWVSPHGYADDEATEIRRLLQVVRKSRDAAAWTDAVRTLKGGSAEAKSLVHEVLLDLARERHRTWARSAKAIDALAARLGEGRTSGKRRQAWEEAKDRANEWIFDEERFPVPEQSLITGPMEGYGQAKERGDAAVKAWTSLARALDKALSPALKLKAKKALALDAAYREAEGLWRQVAGELDEADLAEHARPEVAPVAWLLLGLRCGEFAQVADAYRDEPAGWQRLCLFHAYCRAVQAWNEDHPFGMDAGGLAGLQGINEYRMALGISPVAYDERLARCARGHSLEMTKLGYFSHRSPIPQRETKEKRAALEGYTAQVVECITGIGGGMAAVEFWKYDGGHHRDMVDPQWIQGGMSTRGPAVYNGGRGEEGAIPAIRY